MRMRFFLVAGILASMATASSWSFKNAHVILSDGSKSSFTPSKPVHTPVALGSNNSKIELGLTFQDGGSTQRPHQGILLIEDPQRNLHDSLSFTIDKSGRAKLTLLYSRIPNALLSCEFLKASIVVGSFGSAQGVVSEAFTIQLSSDSSALKPNPERYGRRPEIRHQFRADPRLPPKSISLVFLLAVVAMLPLLLVSWLVLGANYKHLPKALASAPLSHTAFLASIMAMEFLFFKYYTVWNLFKVLPFAGLIALVSFVSASGALSEVQERRLQGSR